MSISPASVPAVMFVAAVSMGSAAPIPVEAAIVTPALASAASISTPPMSPASVTAPLVVVIATAEVVSLVVTSRPRVIFSSAANVIVPVQALISVPFVIDIIPPDPFSSLSASAVTVILTGLVVRLRSPSTPNITSSSAVMVI